MLKIISIVSFFLALLFSILLIIMLLQKVTKKSLKVRQKIKGRRRLYSFAAALFFLVGLVLQFVALPTADLKEFIDNGSPVDAYQKAVKSSGAEKAVTALPAELFALGNDYYVRTGNNKVYGYLQKGANGEQSYQKGMVYRNVLQVTGGEDLVAVRNKNGVLELTGAFEYLTYEKDDTYFKAEQYAQDCSYADATANTLFYVENGDLYSAGYNAFSVLGDGTERNRLAGAKILENVASVSSGETHTLAVDVYGNLYGFGDNSYSEMGNRTTAQSTTPEKLMGGVKQAEAGRYFSVVLTKNGEVYVAGRNHLGQLGTGDDRDYATYIKILDGIDKIAVNRNSCAAITANGVLYVWGDNSNHQLGAGEAVLRTPTQLAADVYDVAMGESSMGIIKLNRDVFVTGTARAEQNNEFMQAVWQFSATVPENQLYRQTVVMPVRPE